MIRRSRSPTRGRLSATLHSPGPDRSPPRLASPLRVDRIRTRRQWKPNAHRKKLYSETLDEMIQLNVTTHALRSVDKAGGLDAYILSTPPRKLKSISGMRLRERLMEAKGAGKSLPGGATGAAASRSDNDARERDE